MALNHVVIMGRLTRDPERRLTNSGTPVTSFTVAVDRDFSGKDGGQKEVDFIDCVAWKNTAEFVSSYFVKGRMAVVKGRLQIRNYEDKNGNKRKAAEVVAENVYFGDSKPDNQGGNSYGGYNAPSNGYQGGGYGGYGGGYSAPVPNEMSDYGMLEDEDGQLPF